MLLARLDNHSAPTTSALVDLDELVHDTTRRLERTREIEVDRGGVGFGVVRGDADQLQRCVQNVLDNALRYANSRATLTLTEHDNRVELIVTDDGPGIQEAERERVFDRFYRVSDARDRDSGGSGIGLALVKQIINAHGGTVEAHPAEPTGTSIVITLPGTDAD